jgi:hypothetical protein
MTLLMIFDVTRYNHELDKNEVTRQCEDLREQHSTIMNTMCNEQKIVEPLYKDFEKRMYSLREEIDKCKAEASVNDVKAYMLKKHVKELHRLQILEVTINGKRNNIQIYDMVLQKLNDHIATRTAYLENMNLAETLDDIRRVAHTMNAYDLSASAELIKKEVKHFLMESRRPEHLAKINDRINAAKENIIQRSSTANMNVDNLLDRLIESTRPRKDPPVPLESPVQDTLTDDPYPRKELAS